MIINLSSPEDSTTFFSSEKLTTTLKPPRSLSLGRLKAEIETLIGRLREYRENNTFAIVDAWRIHRQLYEERSPRLVFYDLETSYSTKPGKNYRWIFAICMRDAARNLIIHAKVNQGMTVSQLYDASDHPRWQKDVFRWYGKRSDEITSGMDLHQIADTLEKAGINRDYYSMEQSVQFFDHDNLYCNLRENGKHHLVPQRRHVLRLYVAMKLAFWKFPGLKYSLSYMHRLLCPDDSDLASRAHCEDADEEMLYKQAGMYFKGTRTELNPLGSRLISVPQHQETSRSSNIRVSGVRMASYWRPSTSK